MGQGASAEEPVDGFPGESKDDAERKGRDFYGRSALHKACWHGDVQQLRQLLADDEAHVADINGTDRAGCTACHYAIYRGHIECVKLLLEAGAALEWNAEEWSNRKDSNFFIQIDPKSQCPLNRLVMSADNMQVLQSTGLGASSLATTGPVVIPPGPTSRPFLSFGKGALNVPPINVGTYYYEVTLFTGGNTQLGWATKNCGLTEHEGLGDKYGWAYDGCSRSVWHKGRTVMANNPKWQVGDVVGLYIQFGEKDNVAKRLPDGKRSVPFTFRIDLNGKQIVKASECTIFMEENERIYPAISTSGNQCCAFNFGYTPFRHPPPEPFVPVASITKSYRLLSTTEPIPSIPVSPGSLIHWAAHLGQYEILKHLLSFFGRTGALSVLVALENQQQATPLHLASRYGHVRCMQLLLSLEECGGGASEDSADSSFEAQQLHALLQQRAKDKDLKSPFLYACETGQLEAVKYLVSQGSSAKEHDLTRRTGLMYAAEVGNAELVEYLLFKGASVRDKDDQGNTALICAMSENRTHIVELLINKGGSSPDERSHWGHTPLLIAAMKDNREALELLLEKGADINTCDEENTNAVAWAAIKGHLETMKFLIARGADVNTKDAYGNTLLLLALHEGRIDVVRFLLDEHYSTIHERNRDGVTPLMCACQGGFMECVQYLLQQGASLDERDAYGDGPLSVAASAGHIDLMDFLVSIGASVTERNTAGSTPLLIACEAGQVDTVKYLISKGASLENEKDENGAGPLLHAAMGGGVPAIKFLITQKGVSLHDTDTNLMNALLYAAYAGHMETVKFLLSQEGFSVRDRSADGSTPLLLCVEQGHWDVAKMLIENGAALDDQNNNGETPLYLALLQSDHSMANLITDRLTVVDLSSKALTPQAVATLCSVLCENRTVAELNLEDCLIIDESVDPLVELLTINRHLVSINLAHNFILGAEEEKLLEALCKNRSILEFPPWRADLGEKTRDELTVILDDHKQWRQSVARAAVQVLISARVLLQSHSVEQQGCLLAVFPPEIVEMLVASLAGGFLSEEETYAIINWGCDRTTLGRSRADFFLECMREVTCWSWTGGTDLVSTTATVAVSETATEANDDDVPAATAVVGNLPNTT